MVALDYPSDRWRWDRPEKRSRTTDVSGNGPKRLIQLKRIYFGLETGRQKGGRNGASGVGAVDSRHRVATRRFLVKCVAGRKRLIFDCGGRQLDSGRRAEIDQSAGGERTKAGLH
jgi:hypothetical protein